MGEGTSTDLATIDIGQLPTMGRDGLRDLWRKLHRKAAPKGLAGDLLVRALAWRIQCERHGGLTRGLEQRLARAAREAMRNETKDKTPFVGASGTGAGADGSMASVRPASSSPSTLSVRRTLRPGTRLVRAWQGSVHEVTVMPDGFLWDGRTHRSLSVIAKAITGTSWNGWLFFGVNGRSGRIASSRRDPENGTRENTAGVAGPGGAASGVKERAKTKASSSADAGIGGMVANRNIQSMETLTKKAPKVNPARSASPSIAPSTPVATPVAARDDRAQRRRPSHA